MPVSKHHPFVCFGESLWQVLPTGRQAGGAPVNVAYHLNRLGMNPALISRIGYDDLGKQLIETLERNGICTDYFQMDDEKPTGMATAYVKDDCELIYTIYNDVAWDAIEYTGELADLVSDADYFVFGSLAARCKDTYKTLLKLLPAAKVKVFHIHLCAPFYDRRLIETLLGQTDIVQLNFTELELITGWFSGFKQKRDRIELLRNEFHIPMIAVTDGKKGYLLNSDDSFYEYPGFAVPQNIINKNGEAFLAGLIAKLWQGSNAEEILEYATATAAVIANSGELLPQYNAQDILAFIQSNTT